ASPYFSCTSCFTSGMTPPIGSTEPCQGRRPCCACSTRRRETRAAPGAHRCSPSSAETSLHAEPAPGSRASACRDDGRASKQGCPAPRRLRRRPFRRGAPRAAVGGSATATRCPWPRTCPRTSPRRSGWCASLAFVLPYFHDNRNIGFVKLSSPCQCRGLAERL